MWPLDRIRRPSLLRDTQQLLMRLQLIHASQVETNGLLRELLQQHGKSPVTPAAQVPMMIPQTMPTASGAYPPPTSWTLGQPFSPQPMSDTRKGTGRDVTTTHEIPTMAMGSAYSGGGQ